MIDRSDIARFKGDGFLLLKGLFSLDEVARFADAGSHISGGADLASLPGVRDLWMDRRLVDAAKRLLGERITFFGEASYLRIVSDEDHPQFIRNLHHDAKGTVEHLFNRQHAPTPEPYPIIRFAIYLQDHATQSGGLKLVPGSHQIDSSEFRQDVLKYFNVPSEPGDAVVFCNKILHVGYALRLRDTPDTALSPAEEGARNGSDFLPFPRDRRTIFIDYAGSNELADIYIKGRALHPSFARSGLADLAASGFFQDAGKAGIGLRFDAAVVEAVLEVASEAKGGGIGEALLPKLLRLPALCALSQPWSPHFNFIPNGPFDTSPESALKLVNAIVPRINELRATLMTTRKDYSMMTKVKKGA